MAKNQFPLNRIGVPALIVVPGLLKLVAVIVTVMVSFATAVKYGDIG